jgi:hypothetical protein
MKKAVSLAVLILFVSTFAGCRPAAETATAGPSQTRGSTASAARTTAASTSAAIRLN